MPRSGDRDDGAGGRRRDDRHRPADHRPARIHARRARRRDRPHARAVPADRPRRPGRLADLADPARRVGHRLGRVRARGHARPQRQLRHRLLDREHRPDGRPHGRQRHGRAAADAHRPPLPAPARPGLHGHPRGRRRDRWLERPVRGQSRDRGDHGHRDEPARLAVERARLEGHGLPDREDRRAAGRRLRARGDRQRHHAPDARVVRADDRLRRREVAALRVREVRRLRPAPVDAHEVRRRGDGDRAHVPAGVREGDAQPRARQRSRRRGLAARSCSSASSARRASATTSCSPPSAPGAEPEEVNAITHIDLWFLRELQALALDPDGPLRRHAQLPRRRHLRRGVRRRDAVLLLRLGARRRAPPRGPPRRAAERRHPRRRPEPHRPGHRVRLLLRARGDDRPRIGPRRGDDQLQPGDRLDGLRHLRSPVLRAADARGRARRRRASSSPRASSCSSAARRR